MTNALKRALIRRLGITAGLRHEGRLFLEEVRYWRAHRRGLQRAAALRPHEAIHVGSGDRLLSGWLNIDMHPAADLALDLREPLPFPNQSASTIFAEHFFEHLRYPQETSPFLAGIHRVLRPGGQLLLSVPDIGGLMDEFGDPDSARYRDLAARRYGRTRVEQLNVIFRQVDQHKFAYDFETLKIVLEEAGFADVAQREFDPRLDQEARRFESLLVRAVKPRNEESPHEGGHAVGHLVGAAGAGSP